MAKGDLRGVKGLNDGLAEISRDLGKVADKLHGANTSHQGARCHGLARVKGNS